MENKRISLRLAEKHQEMLQKIIEKKQIQSTESIKNIPVTTIFKEAISYTFQHINILNDKQIKESIVDMEFRKNNAILFEKSKRILENLQKIYVDCEIICEKIPTKNKDLKENDTKKSEYIDFDFIE